jgi:hypothetical protein
MPPQPFVYRVRVEAVNGHRLTADEARNNGDTVVWRVISARRNYSHWEYLFDDYVLEPNIPSYFAVSSNRGAERISLHRLGVVKEVLGTERKSMKGAGSLNPRRTAVPLETFLKKPRRRSR